MPQVSAVQRGAVEDFADVQGSLKGSLGRPENTPFGGAGGGERRRGQAVEQRRREGQKEGIDEVRVPMIDLNLWRDRKADSDLGRRKNSVDGSIVVVEKPLFRNRLGGKQASSEAHRSAADGCGINRVGGSTNGLLPCFVQTATSEKPDASTGYRDKAGGDADHLFNKHHLQRPL